MVETASSTVQHRGRYGVKDVRLSRYDVRADADAHPWTEDRP